MKARTESGEVQPPREPERVREMVQRDHRHDGLLAHLAQHVAVVADLLGVEDFPIWLDARPLMDSRCAF
jgi:hypothetical protein